MDAEQTVDTMVQTQGSFQDIQAAAPGAAGLRQLLQSRGVQASATGTHGVRAQQQAAHTPQLRNSRLRIAPKNRASTRALLNCCPAPFQPQAGGQF